MGYEKRGTTEQGRNMIHGNIMFPRRWTSGGMSPRHVHLRVKSVCTSMASNSRTVGAQAQGVRVCKGQGVSSSSAREPSASDLGDMGFPQLTEAYKTMYAARYREWERNKPWLEYNGRLDEEVDEQVEDGRW